MIEALKTRIKESEHPVGTKRPGHITLPPEDHVYGLETKKDKEGVSVSKLSFLFHYIFNLISYEKLESARTIKNSTATTGLYYHK